MKFNKHGLLVTIAGAVFLWLGLRGRVPVIDEIISLSWVAYILVLSIAMLVGRAAGRRVGGQDGAWRELRRWFHS